MRIPVLLLAFVLPSGLASAQSDLELLRDEKLAEAWVKNAPWITDYDAALERAQETGKPVFAYFTRSYAP